MADVFAPGRHELATRNLPVLSRLRGWKYGFESPFKADVVFVSTRQFPSHKWGTKTPVMMTDRELGPLRLRSYGTYIVRVSDAATFVTQLVGAHSMFAIDQISDQIRDLIVARFAEVLGEESVSILKLASRYSELGEQAKAQLKPDLARLGLELTQLVVESIALPDEVAATLDQRTRIGLIGDVGAYAALQAADAVRDSARNTGTGGAGAAVGIGIAMAGQLAHSAAAAMQPAVVVQPTVVMQPTVAIPAAVRNAPPAMPTPPSIPQDQMFYLAVDGQPLGPFDLAALWVRASDGRLTRDTLVWRHGMVAWVAAGQVPDVAGLLGPR